ncbi:reverse transcriptase domain-containing protein [Tanacetum coccineum]
MPFGLCNAPATFQRCMLAIFHDMIEESVEVYMDDFSVFGNSFDNCLNNLDKMLQRCKDANLVLNWEKCHFMVKEGIVLGHKVSGACLEVDKAKIDVISKLPPLTNVKGIRSFLGHADFYRHFIKDFSKIARPLTKLLEKDTPFKFDDECHKAFNSLKEKLTFGAVLEFDIEIKDKKGTENVATDHLSRIENDETSNESDVNDNFPGETLMEITTKDEPWFVDFANYLAGDVIPKGMTYQQKKKILLRPQKLLLGRSLPFQNYVSKWDEAQALPTNDARVVISFMKKLFCHFVMPNALISNRGTHFCNKIMEKTMKRYGVNHRFSTSYHPQTSGQVENTNKALKRILEKTVKDNPAQENLTMLCGPFDPYKTPTRTTPYKLVYGKNCHLPFEIEHRAYWALKNCNHNLIVIGEKRMFQLHELDEFRHQAYENSQGKNQSLA